MQLTMKLRLASTFLQFHWNHTVWLYKLCGDGCHHSVWIIRANSSVPLSRLKRPSRKSSRSAVRNHKGLNKPQIKTGSSHSVAEDVLIAKNRHQIQNQIDIEHMFGIRKKTGRLMTSMLLKTYVSLKGRQLLSGNWEDQVCHQNENTKVKFSDWDLKSDVLSQSEKMVMEQNDVLSQSEKMVMEQNDVLSQSEKMVMEQNDVLSQSEKMAMEQSDVLSQENDCCAQSTASSSDPSSLALATAKLSKSASENTHEKKSFLKQMYLKYQFPSPEEARDLSLKFPKAQDLFDSVVSALHKAGQHCVKPMVSSSHLGNHYWKATLTWVWPYKIKVTGIHPEKKEAERRAYLLACLEMKNFGLISCGEDGKWQLMSSDRVVAMLETLSKFGDVAMGSSKGRGFKIVLEQCKEETFHKNPDTNEAEKLKPEWRTLRTSSVNQDQQSFTVSGFPESLYKLTSCHHYHGFQKGDAELDDSYSDFDKYNSSTASEVDGTLQNKISNLNNGDGDYDEWLQPKSKWGCQIHIGWPVPFSVKVASLSLPAAQMLAYLAVAHRLKVFHLLNKENAHICRNALQKYVVLATRQHWSECVNQLRNWNASRHLDVDAEIFCDASSVGFGAYLVSRETKKVSWISESWSQHEGIFDMMMSKDKQSYLSTLAELFALVTAVCSWKHKLRSRRVLCISDNETALGLISLLNCTHHPSKPDLDFYDLLILRLQTVTRHHSISLHPTWHSRDQNWLADQLSRNHVHTFKAAVPYAAAHRTKAKINFVSNLR